jgi:hypothetical protein
MTYNLVLSELTDGVTRAIGEDIFLEDLLSDYKVYLFYYSGAMPDLDLEVGLRNLGNRTGKNLFINIGRLDDPRYDIIRDKFKIRDLPVIIVTGVDGLASLKDEDYSPTVYVRIDNKDLINSATLTVSCIERLFNLFIGREIFEALNQAKKDSREASISHIKIKMVGALRQLGKFLWEKDINVSLLEGKLQIKNSRSDDRSSYA